jgi:Zn-finger nucleic acid-binding protein
MSDRQGIEIDFCPECRGVWLDRGELDKLIDKSASSSNTQSESYHKKYDDEYNKHGYKRRKREGFLGDLFDF